MKKLIKTKKFSRLITVMLVISVIASIFCVSASAASYVTTPGTTTDGYSCRATLQFGTSDWGATGTLTCETKVASMGIYISYTYRLSGTATNVTETKNLSNTDSSLLVSSKTPNRSCSANISASGSFSIRTKAGGTWNQTLHIS